MLFNTKKQTVKIEGMMCEHCAKHVKEAVLKIKDVKSCDVNLNKKEAVIKSKNGIENELLTKAVESVGYKVTEII